MVWVYGSQEIKCQCHTMQYRFGGLLEASFLAPLGQVDLLVLYDKISPVRGLTVDF